MKMIIHMYYCFTIAGTQCSFISINPSPPKSIHLSLMVDAAAIIFQQCIVTGNTWQQLNLRSAVALIWKIDDFFELGPLLRDCFLSCWRGPAGSTAYRYYQSVTAKCLYFTTFPFRCDHPLVRKKTKTKQPTFDQSRLLFAKKDELCVAVISRIYLTPSHQHDLTAMWQNSKRYKCAFPFLPKAFPGRTHSFLFLAVVILWKNQGRTFF